MPSKSGPTASPKGAGAPDNSAPSPTFGEGAAGDVVRENVSYIKGVCVRERHYGRPLAGELGRPDLDQAALHSDWQGFDIGLRALEGVKQDGSNSQADCLRIFGDVGIVSINFE
jgi:hypothetical protein